MCLDRLKGREKGLWCVGLVGRMDDMNLVLGILWWRLWDYVVDVLDLSCAGVMVSLLDRVGSLWGWFSGLRVMGMVDLLLLVSPLH